MQILSRNELEQIANKKGIKKYKNMSKEGLLISLWKSEQSIVELCKSKSNGIGIEEIKRKFNMIRNKFSKEKIKEIRKKFHKKEKIDKYFGEEEKKNETKQEEREKKHYTKELKKVEEFLKKLEEDINRLEKHRYRDNGDLDYKGIRQIENLFNKIDEDYYKPIKTKGAFNNNYIEYESRGDKDKRSSIKGYLYKIMSYLKNMTNNLKATIRDSNDLSGEWKIQLAVRINFCFFFRPRKKSYNGLKKW